MEEEKASTKRKDNMARYTDTRCSQTELDTTVFGKKNIMTDGLGKTTGGGKVQAADIEQAMALSGDTLPQVSSTGGSISGTFHVVTTDGAGPLRAVLDSTGTGAFSQGTELEVTQQVPGNGGNIRPDGSVRGGKRSLWERASTIVKRASNVNMDFVSPPLSFRLHSLARLPTKMKFG